MFLTIFQINYIFKYKVNLRFRYLFVEKRGGVAWVWCGVRCWVAQRALLLFLALGVGIYLTRAVVY